MDKRTRVAQENCASIDSTILEVNCCFQNLQTALQEASVQLRDMNYVNHRYGDEYRFRLDEFGKALNSKLKTQIKVITDAKRDREFDLAVHSILGEMDAIRSAAQYSNLSKEELERRIHEFSSRVWELESHWPNWIEDTDHPNEEIRRYSWLIECGWGFIADFCVVEEIHRNSKKRHQAKK